MSCVGRVGRCIREISGRTWVHVVSPGRISGPGEPFAWAARNCGRRGSARRANACDICPTWGTTSCPRSSGLRSPAAVGTRASSGPDRRGSATRSRSTDPRARRPQPIEHDAHLPGPFEPELIVHGPSHFGCVQNDAGVPAPSGFLDQPPDQSGCETLPSRRRHGVDREYVGSTVLRRARPRVVGSEPKERARQRAAVATLGQIAEHFPSGQSCSHPTTVPGVVRRDLVFGPPPDGKEHTVPMVHQGRDVVPTDRPQEFRNHSLRNREGN